MMFGPGLYPGEEAAKATGIESVAAREELQAELDWNSGMEAAPSTRPTVPKSWDARRRATLRHWRALRKNDPWDGRMSREEAFLQHLKSASPQSKIEDLDRSWTNYAALRVRARLLFCARQRGLQDWALSKRCATQGPA